MCTPNSLWKEMFSPIVELATLPLIIWSNRGSLFVPFIGDLHSHKVTIFATSLLLVCLHLADRGRKSRHRGLLYRETSRQGIVVGAVISLTFGLIQISHSSRHSSSKTMSFGTELTNLSYVYAQYTFAMFIATILYGFLFILNIDITFAAPVIMLSLGFLQDHFTDTNFLIPLTAAVVYVAVYMALVKLCPRSFSIGEAVILSQGLAFLLIDYTFLLLLKSGYGELLGMQNLDMLETRVQETLFLSTLIACSFFISVCLSPVFYCLAWYAKTAHDSLIYSTAFYIGGVMNVIAIFMPSSYIVLGVNPVWYLISFAKPSIMLIVCYWAALLVLAISVVIWNKNYNTDKNNKKIPNIVIRKLFHFIGILIFVPGIYFEPNFTKVASGVAVVVLVILEYVRIFTIYPFGNTLNKYLTTFVDERDRGYPILTHLYLLFGFSIPIWIFPFNKVQPINQLLPYSGVISLGFGDTFASLIGRFYGKTRIPGGSKTFIGTFACFLSQMIACIVLLAWYNEQLYLARAARLTCAILATSIMEAVTAQIDNLILSPVLFTSLFLLKI